MNKLARYFVTLNRLPKEQREGFANAFLGLLVMQTPDEVFENTIRTALSLASPPSKFTLAGKQRLS